MGNPKVSAKAVPVAGAAAVLTLSLLIAPTIAQRVIAQDTATTAAAQRETALSLESAFMRVADTVGPATVSVIARIPETPRPDSEEKPEDERFDELFGDEPDQSRRRNLRASGSGVIVRADGYILTNDHIVEEARGGDLEVTLSDGTSYRGKALRDTNTDLAVIKIDPEKPLPFVRLADSGQIKVGQWAIAIGSPFGQPNTMTTGIVSALHRRKTIGDTGRDARFYPNLVQTDASINPGNSGGPLLNIRGELIGINVAIYSPTGTNAGIGFAIPANTAKRVMDQLIADGKVTRGYLGLIPSDVPPGLRKRLGVSQGAYITRVDSETPADEAGLLPDDVVTRIGTEEIKDESDFRDLVAATKPGTKLSLNVLRGGKNMTIAATVAAIQAPPRDPASTAPLASTPCTPGQLGFDPRPLADSLRTEGVQPGVYVRNVRFGSPASEARLVRGHIITSINGAPVQSVSALETALKSARPGETLTFRVLQRSQGQKPAQAVVNITVP